MHGLDTMQWLVVKSQTEEFGCYDDGNDDNDIKRAWAATKLYTMHEVVQ